MGILEELVYRDVGTYQMNLTALLHVACSPVETSHLARVYRDLVTLQIDLTARLHVACSPMKTSLLARVHSSVPPDPQAFLDMQGRLKAL
ncbi:hypothetical protein TNCV_466021 [Trichonephila clavipes]|nr:hypothetical protein TNCV_466021 [Trichonephila clavipes]